MNSEADILSLYLTIIILFRRTLTWLEIFIYGGNLRPVLELSIS